MIGDVTRLTTLARAETIGRNLTEQFCHGDVNRWPSRKRRLIDLRRLSEQPEVSFSPSTLSTCIDIYLMCQKLGLNVYRYRHLGVHHLRAALNLPENEQWRLLEKAEKKRWTAEKMARKCKEARMKCPWRTGRGREDDKTV